MKAINHIKFHCAIMLVATFVAIVLSTTSCGSDKSEEEIAAEEAHRQNRYKHIEKIARLYSDKLMAIPTEGMDVEELLMNINSRSHALMAQGDTLTALYFRQIIEEQVRNRDNDRADLIFGKRPYSAFTIED